MTLFVAAGKAIKAGGPQQVYPVDYEAEASLRLLDAALRCDLRTASECLRYPHVDVNFSGAVLLRSRRAEVLLRDGAPDEVAFQHEELRTDVTPLFLAAHGGSLDLVRKLLSSGADVNMKLFRGFATTAAVREGRVEILELLLKSGASQPACEEALVEACYQGRAKHAELLMGSDLIRHHVAVHALVSASSRGFTDVVETLVKCGVDVDATDRVLLRSCKPSLHTNVNCTALIATIVSKQVAVVHQLLQVGVRRDVMVKLGAWSWDTSTGEEIRVGAGLAEPYPPAWCAVEYFESTGSILRMLLREYAPSSSHRGRTLLHHAVLCGDPRALTYLLAAGADPEVPVKTSSSVQFRAIHIAARFGLPVVLQTLVDAGCDLNSRTDTGDTAAMICSRFKQPDCLKVLVVAGANLGVKNSAGATAASIASCNKWADGFQHCLLDVMRGGKLVYSSNARVFSSVIFAAQCGDVGALEALLHKIPRISIDERGDKGCSALMVAAREGHVEAFRYLVHAGADVKLCNESCETAVTIYQSSAYRDQFEKVMLEYALEKGVAGDFHALHCAARRGDMAAVRLLANRGHDVNLADREEHTPLMLAAREGHGAVCELLISHGARCDVSTSRGETALSLARARARGGCKDNDAERVILDELARAMVVKGASVRKHTKRGKGSPHEKVLRMVEGEGVLRWGRARRQNVVCVEAEVGPSAAFERNRRRKGDACEEGVFRVVTREGREVHFVCEGAEEMAEMWVRGIKLVTRMARPEK